MRVPSRIILTIIVASLVLSFFPGNVQAADTYDSVNSMAVSIRLADYLDLDADGIGDDIITEFIVSVPSMTWHTGRSAIYCLLVLPSGQAFGCNILVIGFYSQLSLTLAWYNTAYESGWYTFSVAAYMIGKNVPAPGYDTMEFDPPTDGEPGSPVIQIVGVFAV